MDELPSVPPSSDLMIKTKVFEMDNNIAAMLSYVPFLPVNIIASVIWLASEPKSNKFLRYHAIQSLGLTIACTAVWVVIWIATLAFAFIPFLGFLGVFTGLLGFLTSAAFLLGNIYLMVSAYKGKRPSLPFIGEFADSNA